MSRTLQLIGNALLVVGCAITTAAAQNELKLSVPEVLLWPDGVPSPRATSLRISGIQAPMGIIASPTYTIRRCTCSCPHAIPQRAPALSSCLEALIAFS